MQRTGIHTITFTARCESGLHIGGSQDGLTIGGGDNPVIKNPATDAPYIPGSSLKGKMRAELEKELGRFDRNGNPADDGNRPCGCGREQCAVCRVFGAHFNMDSPLGPSRILVRDGQVMDSGYRIEDKNETAIDRRTGSAMRGSLRSTERVAPGARFAMKITLQVFENDGQFQYAGQQGGEALQAIVARGLRLVELTGLGGGSSRGSGAVSFHDFQLDGAEWTYWSG